MMMTRIKMRMKMRMMMRIRMRMRTRTRMTTTALPYWHWQRPHSSVAPPPLRGAAPPGALALQPCVGRLSPPLARIAEPVALGDGLRKEVSSVCSYGELRCVVTVCYGVGSQISLTISVESFIFNPTYNKYVILVKYTRVPTCVERFIHQSIPDHTAYYCWPIDL